MTITIRNIFTSPSAPAGLEKCSTLFENAKVRVERIVSNAHRSPADFWYDQSEDEWVIVLRGQARLEFAGGESMALCAGDYVTIASHVRHRVSETDAETIWLAMHVKARG